MKIALLNDTADHANWGSQAVARTFREILNEEFPGAELASVNSVWMTRKFKKAPPWLGGSVYWGPHRVLDRYSRPFHGEPVFADDFELVLEQWRAGEGGPFADEVLRVLSGADLAIFNAEGSTYRRNISAVRCLFALWFARRAFGIPGVFLNGSVMLTPLDPTLPAIVGKAFRTLGGVGVREPASLRTVREHVPDLGVEVVPDSTFRLARGVPGGTGLAATIRREHPVFFCLSSSMIHALQPAPLRFGVRRTALHRLVEGLKELVPHVVVLAKDKEDQEFMRAIADAAGGDFVGPSHSVEDILEVLAAAQFLVSGRYHHIIFASTVGCPSLPFRTTSHKIDGLCELLEGAIGSPVDPTDMEVSFGALVARARGLLEQGEALRERLRDRSRRLGDATARMGKLARAALGGQGVR